MHNNRGIKSILTTIFILLLVVPLLGLIGFSWKYASDKSITSIQEKNMELASSLGKQVQINLDETNRTLTLIAATVAEDIETPQREEAFFRRIISNYPQFENIGILDDEGDLQYQYPEGEETRTLFPGTEVPAKIRNDIYWSNSFPEPETDEPILLAATSFSDGYITARIDVDEFRSILLDIGDEYEAVIYDGNGTAVASTNQTEVLERVNHRNREHVQRGLEGEKYTGIFFSYNRDQEMLASSYPLTVNDWVVVVATPREEAFALINRMSYILIMGVLITVFITIIIARRKINRITAPLLELTRRTGQIARGYFNTDIDIDEYREVNNLAQSFATMAEKLQAREKRLKEKINETEQKQEQIEEQKHELEASYQQVEAYNQELTALNEELEQSYEEVSYLASSLENVIELISHMGKYSYEDRDEFLRNLLYAVLKIIPESDYGSIYTCENDRIEYIESVGHKMEILTDLPLKREHLMGNREQIDKIRQLENPVQLRMDNMEAELGQKFARALQPIKESLIFNIQINDQALAGISIDISSESEMTFSENSLRIMDAIKNMATTFFKMQWYSKQQGEFQKEIILSIIQMLSIHDEYTTNHSQKVAQLASRLGEELGLSRKRVKDCYWSGLIHDIGKTLIPARILNKQGPLTKDEYEQIKKHPVWGYQTIKKSSQLQELAEYVLYHHEHWDGKGYPAGLEKEGIPLISQILQVADSWDAMTSDRSYRKALTRGEAVTELKENSGTQFAPEIVKAMLKLIVTQEVK